MLLFAVTAGILDTCEAQKIKPITSCPRRSYCFRRTIIVVTYSYKCGGVRRQSHYPGGRTTTNETFLVLQKQGALTCGKCGLVYRTYSVEDDTTINPKQCASTETATLSHGEKSSGRLGLSSQQGKQAFVEKWRNTTLLRDRGPQLNDAHVKNQSNNEGKREKWKRFDTPVSHRVADGRDVHDDQPLYYLRVKQRRHGGRLSSHAVPDQHRL